ncbi:MAG TPA: response regulator [Verrucomicrobiae bacterium]|nr:response regulator [Verrucomicrobiae bacterium]
MTATVNPNIIHILLVDDDPGDVRLTLEALKRSKLYSSIDHVENGEEALAYLRRQGKYANATLPDLVLLDLNMPRKDGRETLEEIKSDPELHRIPVVVLTTSSSEADVLKSYDLGANCYITKPVDLAQFMKVINVTEAFWFAVVKLPAK